MDIQERVRHLPKPMLALIVVTAILSIGGVITSIAPAMDGEAYGYTRIGLGLLGVAGAALVLFGRDYGRSGQMVIMAWAAVQSIYYATVPDGNYTKQLIDALAGMSSQTAVNGVITQYDAIGLNLVGAVMLVFAFACRKHVTYWENRATRGFTV